MSSHLNVSLPDDLNSAVPDSIQVATESVQDSRSGKQLRDRILVTGLRFYGYTGDSPAERELGQWFEVDFELWADLKPQRGQLSSVTNYRSTIQLVAQLIKASRFEALEHLVEAIATLILKETGAPQVRVRLTKCHPPIPDMSGSVAIEIIRP